MIGKNGQDATITEEEAELYDRQIRLWGLDSQKRLRQARVLIFGMSALGSEVAKNVILAGVKSLMLMDNAEVTNSDIATNFTLTEADVGKNRAVCSLPNIQKLNPMVDCTTCTMDIKDKNDDFFKQFDVVCVLGCTQETCARINEICHSNQIHFMTGDSFGMYGFAFFDLGKHEYSEEVPPKPKKQKEGDDAPNTKKRKIDTVIADDEKITVKKTVDFIQLSEALKGKDTTRRSPALFDLMKIIWNFKDKHNALPLPTMDNDQHEYLQELLSHVEKSLQAKPALALENILNHTSGEFAPTSAIIGGVIGQEIIKAVSQKDAPLNNFFIFDGTEGSGYAQQFGH